MLAAAPETKAADPVLVRGEKLKGATTVEMKKLLESPSDFDGKTVMVEAALPLSYHPRRGAIMRERPCSVNEK